MTGEIKLNENTIVRIEDNKAEIISDKTYKLVLILEKNKVIANYSNMSLAIEFDKFDVEKLAKKIHNIVRQSHKFSILTIQRVLVMLSVDELYNNILRKLRKVKDNGDIKLLLKVYNLLNEGE